MLEIMYEMPSLPNLEEVIIEEETITEGKPPRLEYHRDYGVPS